jgi:hypothetical protein
MSLYGTGVGVGDGVILNTETTAERVNSYQSDRLDRGTQFVVTRVYTNRVQVRTVAVFTSQYSNQARGRSYILDKGHLDMDDGATRAAEQAGVTVPRRLGKKPEDTEEMTYIGIDHPGIQWLFEDMGKYATDQGYCPQYDALCARLGIPGRPRNFNVSQTINGINIVAQVQARSQAEANRLVHEAIRGKAEEGPSDNDPEPEPTPSDPRYPIAA